MSMGVSPCVSISEIQKQPKYTVAIRGHMQGSLEASATSENHYLLTWMYWLLSKNIPGTYIFGVFLSKERGCYWLLEIFL